MKRNMKLLRMILQYAEREGNCTPLVLPDFEEFTRVEVNYHVGLCHQAGYLKVIVRRAVGQGDTYDVLGLTWEGHEFLKHSRD